MKAKPLFQVSLVVLLVVGAVISGATTAGGAPDNTTVVYVDPYMNSVPVGHNFTININVANVTNLAGWEVNLRFNTAVLYTNETMITEGPFLSQNGTYPTKFSKVQEVGLWSIGSHITESDIGVSGNGTLATVTFLVQQEGYSSIDLSYTSLGDPDMRQIPHTAEDGYFSNVRDIAVRWPVKFPQAPPYAPGEPYIVSVGEPVLIDVTVANQGNVTETFNVTAYANTTAIQTLNVTNLPPGNSTTLTFVWNTTGFAKGNYTISANASILEGEIDTDNNSADARRALTLTYAPAAIFTYSPAYPLVGENVTFDATASFDPDGYIVNFTWNFGDGTIDTTNKTIIYHVYTSAAYYVVNLTVTDNNNLTDTELKSIAIGKPNASFTFAPDSPVIGQTVTFNASLSTPRGGTITGYKWDFGDGNITTVTDPIIEHVYSLPGTHTVTLNVTDSEGMWDTESKPITVRLPVAPVAAFTFTPTTPVAGDTVTFTATASSDPDGTIVSYKWDFGDGNITTVAEPTITHVYTASGNYTVTLKVTDNDALIDTETKSITVQEPTPPPPVGLPPYTLYAVAAIVVLLLAATAVYYMKIKKH